MAFRAVAARRARRADRPVDAGDRHPRSHLLPRHLLRDAGPAVARRATTDRPGVARAKDGLVDLGCGTAQQWFDLCAMTGHQDWIDEESPLSITEQANMKADELYGWVESHDVDEIRELATAFRIPNAPVANGANIDSLDHFEARGSFVTNPRDGFRQPGHPYRMTPAHLRPPPPRHASVSTPSTTASEKAGRKPDTRDATRLGGNCRTPWAAGARHDHVLGGPVLHASARHARCRRHPPRVHPPPGRHPADRGHPYHRGPVVGEVADLLRSQHQQAGHHAGPAERCRT